MGVEKCARQVGLKNETNPFTNIDKNGIMICLAPQAVGLCEA